MKKTRFALWQSFIALVLCISMLIGSTFAWFTDSVASGNNIIKAGNLDVEMYWTDDLTSNNWRNAENEADGVPFDYDKWEPGYTEVRYVKIVNAGKLALKYALSLGSLGQVGKLAEVIGVYYSTGVTANVADRSLSGMSSLGYLKDAVNGGNAAEGALLPAQEIIVAVALHMDESAGNDYQKQSVGDGFVFKLVATQAVSESDSFDNQYDADAIFPEIQGGSVGVSISGKVDASNKLTEDVNMTSADGKLFAVVPEGTLLKAGVQSLQFSVTPKAGADSNVTLEENEQISAWDVHIEGLDENNTVPALITVKEAMAKGLNIGNYSIYHLEDGATVKMTAGDLTVHNGFTYDPATGDVVLALASFSEVALVADTENAWEGEFDYTWYDADAKDLIIANADHLAAFGAIVGGMAKDKDGNKIAIDSFASKTVKLVADVNLGDKESENKPDIIFYPIGYYNSTGSYEKVSGGSVTSSVSSFEGTFDGNGHTISNFYQNTWEMFGDYNDGYSGTPNHYKDAMGLFGYVVNGKVCNLTIDNFSSDGEFTPTGVIAAYAVNSTFENIAITNCNPRVYNTGNGGIVGIGGNSDDPDTYKLTFNNITIDNTNKITALWGSWDVACGGLVGMFRGAGHVHMTNCHVAAQIDVYNDVCGNYQYYWYRYSGMMVGTNKNMITDAQGYTVPETSKFHAENCTVHFGDWNDYYYCELVANSLASYTHDHQFSRLEQIQSVSEIQDANGNWKSTGNYILMEGKTPTETCYHIMKDANGNLYEHKHNVADATNPNVNEVVNGETVLKENNQRIYLPFNQLFTGYGWGVKHIPIYDDGTPNPFAGVTILDRTEANSVEKFEGKVTELENNKEYKLSDIFSLINSGVELVPGALTVTVTNLDENNPVTATIDYDLTNWENGTITLTGAGSIQITIQDYYFCTPTTIEVSVTDRESEEKFDVVMNNGDFLHRVGNSGTVPLDKLFKAKDGVSVGTISVTVEAVAGTSASGTYSNNAIQFSGTGVVKVTITDNDYCIPTELYLEVVDAVNATTATSATKNNVVLLNNTSGTFTVSNGHTFYGNGFTVTLPTTSVQNVGNGFTGYISIGATQDDGIANGGNLDNVRIEGPVYPEMYIYRDQAKITDKSDPDYGDGNNMRYFKNSVIVYGGNVTISNCYISGSRTALCLRGGNNVVIENTTLSGGAYANMQICAGSSVTLRDITTVQTDVTDSYGKGKTAHGLGIAVDSSVVDVYIEGELNQHNWLNEKQWDAIVPSNYNSVFPEFFSNNTFSKHWHYLNGGTAPYVNLAFIFACNWDTNKIHDNRTTVDYGKTAATIAGVAGGVYSKVNTVGGNAITNSDLADPGYTSPGFNPVAPNLNFDNTSNNDDDDANDTNDTYCVYNESNGTLKIGVSGDSKTIDLTGVSVTKNGTALTYTAYLNGTQISGNSVTIKAADGAKQTLTFKATSNDVGYDTNGNPIAGSIEYTWTVTIEIATLSYPAPVWNMGGDYQFDTSNCVYAYYATTSGYGEAVPIYEGIKINYYDKNGTLVELDLSGTTTLPTGSNNSNANAFTYTLDDGSTLTMKFSSGWKSGATTHEFTKYNEKVYIYPQSLDNDNYIRAKTTNQDFDVKITYTFTDPNGQSTGEQTMRWYNAKASNGNVSTVQWQTFDSINGKKSSVCVTADTLVTLADGTQKRVDQLTYEDQLLGWNVYEGEYQSSPVAYIIYHGDADYRVINLNFSDGTTIKIIGEHGFLDATTKQYVFIDEYNVDTFIGHQFVKENNGMHKYVTLESYCVKEEHTGAYSIATLTCNNAITGSMITLTPVNGFEDSERFFNITEFGENMAFDQNALQADVEKYGLFTYEDLSAYLTEEEFAFVVAMNGHYCKIAIEKGLYTMEEFLGTLSHEDVVPQ